MTNDFKNIKKGRRRDVVKQKGSTVSLTAVPVGLSSEKGRIPTAADCLCVCEEKLGVEV